MVKTTLRMRSSLVKVSARQHPGNWVLSDRHAGFSAARQGERGKATSR